MLVTELDGEQFEPMRITRAQRTRAYVKIEDGCESKCSYCAIAAARGPVRSKRPEDVVAEVEGLFSAGTREIVLTGIETGSYGKDLDEDFDLGDLIALLDRRHSCERIRLGSLAPELIGESFISKVRDTSILAPHFHLSMQSGSNTVLRRMRRRYTAEMALHNMNIIKEAFPTATFTTDLMVGFPDESEEEFRETLDFVGRAEFLDCHVFAFSAREGTVAAGMSGQVSEEIKRQRSERLIDEKNRVRDLVIEKICRGGESLSCVFESRSGDYFVSHSDTFVPVKVKTDEELSGEMREVRPLFSEGGAIIGELID